MSRYDQLEINIAEIIRQGVAIDADAVHIRREEQHRSRNLGYPLVEIECETRNREALCDIEDLVTADVKIRLSGKQRNSTAELNEIAENIIAALKARPNLNMPEDVGAMNDWIVSAGTLQDGETRRLELTLTVRLTVPVDEV